MRKTKAWLEYELAEKQAELNKLKASYALLAEGDRKLREDFDLVKTKFAEAEKEASRLELRVMTLYRDSAQQKLEIKELRDENEEQKRRLNESDLGLNDALVSYIDSILDTIVEAEDHHSAALAARTVLRMMQ